MTLTVVGECRVYHRGVHTTGVYHRVYYTRDIHQGYTPGIYTRDIHQGPELTRTRTRTNQDQDQN